MQEGATPDLLAGVTSNRNSFVDFSIENEHMFKNEGGLTSVDLLCTGKDDLASLAKYQLVNITFIILLFQMI